MSLNVNGGDVRLIVVAHGSSVDATAASLVATLTAELRARAEIAGRFDVEDRYLKQAPLLEDVDWGAPTVVVPFFMARGYFVEHVTRLIAGRAAITPPLGAADFSQIAIAMTREVADDAHLLLVGHGTDRNATSADTLHTLTDHCRPHVRSATCGFVDQSPYLADAMRSISSDGAPIVVLPYFAIPGPHTTHDIPDALGLTGARTRIDGRDVHYLPPITTHSATVELLAALACEAV